MPSSNSSASTAKSSAASGENPKAKRMKRSVPTKLGVFSCGIGTFGELAQGTDVLKSELPALVSGLPDDLKCIDIQCGSMHTLVLLENGEVYSAGCSENNSNGRNPDTKSVSNEDFDDQYEDDEEISDNTPEYDDNEDYYFRKIELNMKITQIAAGNSFSAVLDEDGYVWLWGVFTDTEGDIKSPQKMKYVPHILHSNRIMRLDTPVKINTISAGRDHLLCLGVKNQVFSLGSTVCGQIGRISKKNSSARGGRNGLQRIINPHVANSSVIKPDQLFASFNNTAIKDQRGQIFVCGMNTFHQMGIESEQDNIYSLKRVTYVDQHGKKIEDPIESVSFGYDMSAMLTQSGKVYVCGRTQEDLFGVAIGEEDKAQGYTHKYYQVPMPGGKRAKSVICGADCCAVITEDGKCYVWGTNSYNNLAQLKPSPVTEPKEINLGTTGITQVKRVVFCNPAMYLLAEYDES